MTTGCRRFLSTLLS